MMVTWIVNGLPCEGLSLAEKGHEHDNIHRKLSKQTLLQNRLKSKDRITSHTIAKAEIPRI